MITWHQVYGATVSDTTCTTCTIASIMVGPLLAALVYLPTLWGSFLADDFLLNMLVSHGEAPEVIWSEILADFGRGWFGVEGSNLYRPLITLSFAANYALAGTDPWLYHLTNVLAHVVTSLACALVCAQCSPRNPRLAAVLGGAVFALHPVAAESTCWVASRTTGLQMMFGLLALAAFGSYLRGKSGSRVWLLVLSAGSVVLSLMCKESAAVLPASFVAVDLLVRGPRRVSGRLASLGLIFGIVALYFGLRWLLFGGPIGGSGEGEGAQPFSGDALLGILLGKLTMLLLPLGNSLGTPWSYLCGAAWVLGVAGLVLPTLRSPAAWLLCLGCGVWIAACLAPTWKLGVAPDTLGGSRMIYGAAAALAICLSVLATWNPGRRLTWLLTTVLLAGLAILSTARMCQYLRVYDHMRQLRACLAEEARQASPEHPLAMVSIVPPPEGIPFLNCNALFPLAERPVATTDTALVSLGFVWEPVPFSEHLLFDVGPMRAMREQGALLLSWNSNSQTTPGFDVQRRPAGDLPPLPSLEEEKDRPGWFLAPAPLNPWNVEAVEVEVAGEGEGGRLEWLYSSPEGPKEYTNFAAPAFVRDAPRHAEFYGGKRRGNSTIYYVDLSHLLTFLAQQWTGGLAGFVVVARGKDARPTAVRLLARAEGLALAGRLKGKVIPVDADDAADDAASHLVAPPLPSGAKAMTLYLVGPDTTLTMEVEPGPITLTPKARRAIGIILRSSRQKRYYFYFEATGRRSWRSKVDWVVFR